VNWSVNVGAGVPVYSGPVYAVPQPVYAPQPIYAPPQVVYAPQPVYAQPQPVFYSGIVPYGQVVYYDGWRRPYYVHGGRPVYFREGYGRHHHSCDSNRLPGGPLVNFRRGARAWRLTEEPCHL
jgi:hypothetical protein